MADEAEVLERDQTEGEHEQRQSEADAKAEKARDESGRFRPKDTAAAEKPQEAATVADGDTPPEPTAQTLEPSAADWRALLKDAEAKKQAERFNSLDEVFKSNAEFRKQLSSRIAVPGKDADEKEVAKFRKALGVPDTAEGYDLKLPDGVELDETGQALADAFKEIAHGAHMSNEAYNQAVQKWQEFTDQAVNEMQAQMERQREEAESELRKEWGKDYDGNLNVANRAIKQFAGDEMVEFLNGTELKDGGVLGNHPAMVRLFAKLGRQMSEDGVIQPVDQEEAKDLQGKMEDLTAKIHAAHQKGDRITVEKLSRERSEIAERLYGEQPIVGSGGRAA